MVSATSPRVKSQWMVELKFAQSELDAIQDLQQTVECEEARQRLREVTGISDPHLIARLREAGFNDKNIFALTWLPLALVAWASDGVSDDEFQAAKLVNLCSVLTGQPESADLFHSWLTHKPGEKLARLWEDFVRDRIQAGGACSQQQTGQAILFIANRVAQASGGFLGVGQVSPAERAVLDRIRNVYGLV